MLRFRIRVMLTSQSITTTLCCYQLKGQSVYPTMIMQVMYFRIRVIAFISIPPTIILD
jgi:hypothetical protein